MSNEAHDLLETLSINLSDREAGNRVMLDMTGNKADLMIIDFDPVRWLELADFNPVLRGNYPLECLAWTFDDDGDVDRVITIFERDEQSYGIWTPKSTLNAIASVAFGRPGEYFV